MPASQEIAEETFSGDRNSLAVDLLRLLGPGSCSLSLLFWWQSVSAEPHDYPVTKRLIRRVKPSKHMLGATQLLGLRCSSCTGILSLDPNVLAYEALLLLLKHRSGCLLPLYDAQKSHFEIFFAILPN